MREIKFRAWDKDNERFLESFDYIRYSDGTLGVSDSTPPFNKYGDTELIQYTGLKDKNGVEIYEGDIIRFIGVDVDRPQPTLPVVWDEKSAGFTCKGYNTSRGVDMASGYDTISGEVIGNIYENPEPLKEAE